MGDPSRGALSIELADALGEGWSTRLLRPAPFAFPAHRDQHFLERLIDARHLLSQRFVRLGTILEQRLDLA